MSSSDDHARRGPALLGLGSVLAVAVCTLWFAGTGHLDLYINPRYAVFTVVLAVVAVPASVAGLVVVARGTGHTHDHAGPDDRVAQRPGGPSRVVRAALAGIAVAATVGVTAAMLVLPPTTLSARTAQQRSVDAATLSGATGAGAPVALLGSSAVDTSSYGVKDWAAVIRQTTDTTALVGQRVDLRGFVVHGGDGRFTLTRFVISCCAVDAQPVGITVVSDESVPADGEWVEVSGAFADAPDPSAATSVVIRADSLTRIAEPEDPYEY